MLEMLVLGVAQRDYIGFVDSDDWIKPDMYEVIMSSLLETGADIAVCSYQTDFVESKLIKRNANNIERKIYSSEKAIKRILKAEDYIRIVVWNKLFKRNILYNIKIPYCLLVESMKILCG